MILVLSDLWVPFPGGAERLMFNLARDLMRRGEDVHVLTGYEAAREFDGPQFTCLPIGVFDTQAEGWAMVAGFVAAAKPELIVTHHLYAHQFGRQLIELGIPLVHVVLNGQRLPGAALAVYISEWVRERAEAQPRDLLITPPAFDDVVAAEHGDAIGFVKPIKHKGVELVYDIAALLPHRQFLVLRGEWQDLEDIRALPNVEFMEPVDDIRDFYARCELVLMPSLSEDAGTVAQEAAMNDIPCISSDVDGLAETNGGGLQLTPVDPHEWAAAIERLLGNVAAYEAVVASQRRHLTSLGHGARLDLFAERIAELKGAR